MVKIDFAGLGLGYGILCGVMLLSVCLRSRICLPCISSQFGWGLRSEWPPAKELSGHTALDATVSLESTSHESPSKLQCIYTKKYLFENIFSIK